MASIKALHMRSSQDAIQDKPVRRGATTMPSSRQQRKHPSLYVLRTWSRKCKPVRLTAKARPAGFEPATCGLEVRCSIRLSYGRRDKRVVDPFISVDPQKVSGSSISVTARWSSVARACGLGTSPERLSSSHKKTPPDACARRGVVIMYQGYMEAVIFDHRLA